MDSLRRPPFFLAIALMTLALLIELGTGITLGSTTPQAGDLASLIPQNDPELLAAFNDLEEDGQLSTLASQDTPPGIGIPYLALIDGIALFTVALMGASLLIPHSLHGRIQGIATLVFSILLLLLALSLALAALGALLLMVSLFLAAPFGTLAYLATFGFFNRGGASVVLSFLMALKLGFAISLVIAQQRFLENRGLVFLLLTSIVATVIVSLLHGLVPGFLVSITDAIAALIAAILAILWAIFLLLGSLGSLPRAVRTN